MTRELVESVVKKTIISTLSLTIDSNQIHSQTDIIDDLGLNSVSYIQLIVSLEELLDINIDTASLDISYFKSFSVLMDMLMEKIAK